MLLLAMGDIVPGDTWPWGGTILLLLFLVSMPSGLLLNESVMEFIVLCSPDMGFMERDDDMGKPG